MQFAAAEPQIPPGKKIPQGQVKIGLDQFDIEVSYGGQWISLNDHFNYRVASESLGQTAVSMRRQEATNPIVEGKYLIHAVPEHVEETIRVYVYGQHMVDTMENARTLQKVFTQFDFQVRITMDNHREYWRCQAADWTMERPHTHVHNGMVMMVFQVPRFPTPYYEALV